MWNYRVVRTVLTHEEKTYQQFAIHEAYYDQETGQLEAISQEPVRLLATHDPELDENNDPAQYGTESLRIGLERFITALEKPFIDYETLDPIEQHQSESEGE